eukprot:scaffold15798_cov80-Skeletonema_dohrnii-CCMP3373.AAC.2
MLMYLPRFRLLPVHGYCPLPPECTPAGNLGGLTVWHESNASDESNAQCSESVPIEKDSRYSEFKYN